MVLATIEAAFAWMEAQKPKQDRIGLDKIRVALAYLDNPHLGLKTIHIGGTNGKGSVTAFLKQLFLEQGLSVGAFTSPHIMQFNERITYNRQMITDETLLRLINRLVPLNDYMETTVHGRLVFFELYTVLMFLYFQEKQPDVCLIEVGLGGLADCTNVIASPEVVITTIGLDHTDKLGDTYEAIAYQKAGIIHANATVFIGHLPSSAVAVIEQVCQEQGADLHTVSEYKMMHQTLETGTQFLWKDDCYELQLLGAHQVHNAALALSVFEYWMEKYQYGWDKAAERQALRQTTWMARMEKVSDNPLIYIDGAHNEAGLIALQEMIRAYFTGKPVRIIYAGLMTKNQAAHIKLLSSFPCQRFILTTFNHPQAVTIEQFQALIADSQQSWVVTDDWQQELLQEWAGVTLVTGSLYFVSEIRKFLQKK